MTNATGQPRALDALFRPQSVAVVGASADPTKTGGRPIAYLLKHGFAGRVYPVNPTAREIAGLPCYASPEELPEAPDAAIVLVGADRAAEAVRALAERGVKLAIVLASGFSESGPDGLARQKALAEAAGAMRILGPNTIGAMDLGKGIVLSASGALEADVLSPGAVAVASQSGGILGALLSRGAARGIGFSKLASTGNEADIDLADLIDDYALDERTRVIAVYIEGIRCADKFRRAAEGARRMGKRLVVYKVGRSRAGAKAAVSHTGALAGEDRVYDALFRQVGAIRAETFSDFLDLPAMLATGRQMRGRRVAILTSTGGAGSLIADSCGIGGLDLPSLDPATADRLAEILKATEPQTDNPVDVTLAGVKPAVMTAATETLLASDSVDGVVVVVGSSALAQPEAAVGAITNGAARSDKPLIAYVSPNAPHIVQDLNARGIPAYTTPETCATAFRAAQPQPVPEAAPPAPPAPEAALANLASGTLNEANARDLFARFGLCGAEQRVVHDEAQAAAAADALGRPVVLKVLSRDIAHKADVGGVRLSLSAKSIGPALRQMQRALVAQGLPEPEGFLVQKMLAGGVEMILGLRRDPQLGTFVLLGAGGTFAEVADDSAIRLLPLAAGDAEAMVAELRVARILRGYRGGPVYDIPALVAAIEAAARMGAALGERLGEAEINPLFVMKAGDGVAAADALVVLR